MHYFNSDEGDTDIPKNMLTAVVMARTHESAYDLNADTHVNQLDRYRWVKWFKGTYFGDADLSSEFTSSDMVQVFAAGKYETGKDAGWAEGDWNGDGIFNSSDMVAAFVDGGYEKGPPMNATAVPEPISVMLLMTGLIAVVVWQRRFQR